MRTAERNENRVALVAGAGRGIGRAIALELACGGFALCLAARSRIELEETRKLSGLAPERSLIVLLDLAMEESPGQLIGAALDHFGRIDVLVNNAGWAPPRTPLVKTSGSDQDRMLAVNLRAPIALTRLAAAQMAKQEPGGTIVNISSAAARSPSPGETVYAAAKAGLVAFTHACFAELRQHGIRTSVIIPGVVATALIPHNKRLEANLMLKPSDVAPPVMSILNPPQAPCPLDLVPQPPP